MPHNSDCCTIFIANHRQGRLTFILLPHFSHGNIRYTNRFWVLVLCIAYCTRTTVLHQELDASHIWVLTCAYTTPWEFLGAKGKMRLFFVEAPPGHLQEKITSSYLQQHCSQLGQLKFLSILFVEQPPGHNPWCSSGTVDLMFELIRRTSLNP